MRSDLNGVQIAIDARYPTRVNQGKEKDACHAKVALPQLCLVCQRRGMDIRLCHVMVT